MSRNKLLIILGVIAAAILILFLTKSAGKAASYSCSAVKDLSDQAHCYQWIAITTLDASLCDKISDDLSVLQPKNKCYDEIAYRSKDPAVCDKIEASFTRVNAESCKERITGSKA
jgi:hypothetical protein